MRESSLSVLGMAFPQRSILSLSRTGCFYRDNSTRTGTHVTNGRKEGISYEGTPASLGMQRGIVAASEQQVHVGQVALLELDHGGDMMSDRSVGCLPGSSEARMSRRFGLQVIVMNRSGDVSGGPQRDTIAIAFRKSTAIARREYGSSSGLTDGENPLRSLKSTTMSIRSSGSLLHSGCW